MPSSTMFSSLEMAPPDAILGLVEAYNKDPRPDKINLGAGVYQDPDGLTPVLASVKSAEQHLLTHEKTKNYKPITGDPRFGECVQPLVFGADSAIVKANRAITAHCPGGTGALRVTADFLARMLGGPTVWLSAPTWPNHPAIFEAAGLSVQTYPYFDAGKNSLALDAMLQGLEKIPEGDVVLLHGCCHNPTGVDPRPEQWQRIGEVMARRRLLAIVDFAYQGFGDGLEQDATGLRTLTAQVPELIVCSSFSKNFGLYNERVGALTFVCESEQRAAIVASNIKLCIRANYSNPPAHGAAIVTTILSDPGMRAQWETELAHMRNRINGLRQLFVESLAASGARADLSFILRQRGMFSMSGLNRAQVERLRNEHGIYIVGSGRINVAGIHARNIDKLCNAIAAIL